MRYFGVPIFGVLTLLVTTGVMVFFLKAAAGGKNGGVMAVLVSPILWLALAGPCALFCLIFVVRSLRKRR